MGLGGTTPHRRTRDSLSCEQPRLLFCSLKRSADLATVVNEYVEVDPKLFRTGEIHDLRGDASLARRELNWQPEVDFKQLVRKMVEGDTGVAVQPKAEKKRYVGSNA